MLSIKRQMPTGKYRRLAGQPETPKRGAEFCHRTARTLRCRQLYSAAYVHDRKPKPPPSSFVHLAQWNQSGILPVHGAER
jgi:hypothetical protein